MGDFVAGTPGARALVSSTASDTAVAELGAKACYKRAKEQKDCKTAPILLARGKSCRQDLTSTKPQRDREVKTLLEITSLSFRGFLYTDSGPPMI